MINNVASGVLSTEAANFGQVQAVQTYTAQQVVALNQALASLAAAGVCKNSGNGSYVCGTGASASGQNAIAQGSNAMANGVGAMAFGANAHASFAGSVAIGNGAQANADPTTAVGNNAIANSNNSVAIGANTTANGSNSVAIGQGSVSNRADSMSVGNAATGLTRQITNLAPGTQGTDAVNLNQFNTGVANVLSEANMAAAQAAAVAMAVPQTPILQSGKHWLGVATSSYAGQSAVGLGFGYQINDRWNVGAGASVAYGGGSQVGVRIQTGYEW